MVLIILVICVSVLVGTDTDISIKKLVLRKLFDAGSTFRLRYGFNYADNLCFILSQKFNLL